MSSGTAATTEMEMDMETKVGGEHGGVDRLLGVCEMDDDLGPLFNAFLDNYQEHASLETAFEEGQVHEALTTLINVLQHKQAAKQYQQLELALKCTKLLTRSRRELNSLQTDASLSLLISIADSISSEDAKEPVELYDVVNESLRVLINLCIIHQYDVLPRLHSSKFHLVILEILRHSSLSNHFKLLFASSRILFYMSLELDILIDLRDKLGTLPLLTEILARVCRLPEPTDETYSLIAEILKVLFSIGSQDTLKCQDIWITIHEQLTLILTKPLPSHDIAPEAVNLSSSYMVVLDAINMLFCFNEENLKPIANNSEAVLNILGVLDIQARVSDHRHESSLVPIFHVLKKICDLSADACSLAKSFIFQELANDESKKCEDMKEIENQAKAEGRQRLCMILKKHITSFQAPLKFAVSSFLFTVSGEDPNEYIRLVSFGNAIGHLVTLNLPGFEMVKQQAISVDELIARHEKEKAEEKAAAEAAVLTGEPDRK